MNGDRLCTLTLIRGLIVMLLPQILPQPLLCSVTNGNSFMKSSEVKYGLTVG